jgi:peptidoglycan/LPS O-acetylase OafA/YrhL
MWEIGLSMIEAGKVVRAKDARLQNVFNYVPSLDGWRGIAVLGVVWFHSFGSGLNSSTIWAKVARRGYLGVDIFFAISGFLICGKLLREIKQTGTISLRNFYLRRFFRIMPALWFYLAVLALLGAVGWLKIEGWEFTSSLLFVRNYFPLSSNLFTAHFWSLAVEEHFYLLWPAVMAILSINIRRIGWTALIVALTVYLWRVVDDAYGWFIPFGTSVNAKTDTRIDALLWGCLAAIVYPYVLERLKKSTLQLTMWTLLGLGIAAMDLKLPDVSIVRSIFFPALLLCTAACPGSIPSKFLELSPMRWIGRLSYSIYIWQELCMFPAPDARSPLRVIEHLPYNVAVVFALAACSYYLIERPVIRWGHALTQRRDSPQPRPFSHCLDGEVPIVS